MPHYQHDNANRSLTIHASVKVTTSLVSWTELICGNDLVRGKSTHLVIITAVSATLLIAGPAMTSGYITTCMDYTTPYLIAVAIQYIWCFVSFQWNNTLQWNIRLKMEEGNYFWWSVILSPKRERCSKIKLRQGFSRDFEMGYPKCHFSWKWGVQFLSFQ